MRYYELHFECPPCSQLVTWSPFLPCGSCGLALSKCPALGWWRWLPASICYWSSAQWRSLRHLAGGACWRVMTRDAMPCMRCTLHTSAHNAMCDELSSDMSRLDLISFCLIIVVLVDSIFDSVWFCLILFDTLMFDCIWAGLCGHWDRQRKDVKSSNVDLLVSHFAMLGSVSHNAPRLVQWLAPSGDVELLDPTQPPETQKAKSTNLLLPVFTFSR